MNPFYFGTSERRLFGLYEAARRGPARHAVVLCHPWGAEYLHAYRAMRQLSQMLAAAGIHSLRFDYFGTGDSAGEMTEARLSDWETDIQSAMRELMDITESPRVALVGLRLGATLAADVATKCGAEIDSLVLWDPVVRGEEHVEELRLACWNGAFVSSAPTERPPEIGGGYEILGFPLTAAMADELKNFDLTALAPALPERTLIVASQSLDSHAGLREGLRRRAAGPLAFEQVESLPSWIEWPLGDPRAGATPVKVLQRIVEWFT